MLSDADFSRTESLTQFNKESYNPEIPFSVEQPRDVLHYLEVQASREDYTVQLEKPSEAVMLSELRDSAPDLFASTVSRKPRKPVVEIDNLEMSEVVPDADNRFVGLSEVKPADDSKFFSDKKP